MSPDNTMQTHAELLNTANNTLSESGCKTPKLDARLLLQHVCGLEHASLISLMNEPIVQDLVQEFDGLIDQRVSGRSVHRIIGHREFFGHLFRLSGDTLEPRPDTECLVERVLAEQTTFGPNPHFLDVGTGSGAIAISLLKAMPGASAVASDISVGALETAKANAQALGVEDRLEFVECSYLDGLNGPFDFIVSNPPYIASAEVAKLESVVRDWDPTIALDGGLDGLDAYREILKSGRSVIKPGGKLFLEIGFDQSEKMLELAQVFDLELLELIHDLAGQPRAVVLIYK